MKRILLTATVLAAIAGGGFALAQTPKQAPPTQAAPGYGMMGGGYGYGMMGGGPGMMGSGYGMMGNGFGMMGGGYGMMGGAATKIDVKKIDKGVTITMTSSDPAVAVRLQKMWEAMRLMHEAMAQ